MISEKYFHLFSVSGLFSFTLCVIMMSEQERFLPMMAGLQHFPVSRAGGRFSQWKTSFYAGFTKIRRKIRDSKRPYVAQQRKMECAPGKSSFGKNNPICPFGKNTRSKTERVSLCIIACTLMPFLYMPDVLCVLSHRPVGGEGSSGGDILETLPPKAQPILIVPIGSELGV